MSQYKTIGIAVGTAAVIAGASAGGYVLLTKGGDDTSESTSAEPDESSETDESDAPMAALSESMPEKIDLYIEVPNVRALAQGSASMKVMDIGLLDLLKTLDQAGEGVGKSFGMSAVDGSKLVKSFKTLAIGVRFDTANPFAGVVVYSDKAPIVKKWLSTKRFTKNGKAGDRDKYQLATADSGDAADNIYAKAAGAMSTPPDTSIVWLEKKGLLVVGTDAFLEDVALVATGKNKSLASSDVFKKDIKRLDDKPRLFAYLPGSAVRSVAMKVEEPALIDGFLKDPSAVLMGIYMGEAGMNVALHAGISGDKVPKFAVPETLGLDIGGALPNNTIGLIAFATKLDMSGRDAEKRLVEVVKAFDPGAGEETQKGLDEARDKLGVGLAELVDAVGDQVAFAVVTDEQEIALDDLDKADFTKNVAGIALWELKDTDAMKKVVDAVKKVAPLGRTHAVSATDDGGFEATPKAGEPFIAVRYPKGRLFIGVGAEALVKNAYASVDAGKDTLGDDGAYTLALSGVPAKRHSLSWFDAARMLRKPIPGMDALDGVGNLQEKFVVQGDKRITLANSLVIEPDKGGYRFRLDMLNTMGVLPTFAIHGVRRYLSASKTSEAKNTVGAISRGAMAAYERESAGDSPTIGHVLCKSADPVPSTVPAGTKHVPNTAEGHDFETGDDRNGWRCLKFSMTQPHYFQYGYTAGGPYRGPAVGGPDPGKNGFEAWAVGDLDGDGVTSLFTRTGTIDASGKLKMGTEIFIHNEHE